MYQNHSIKYFIYARKSTDREDKQIASIEDQIRECQKIAQQKGFEVVDIISESKSAKAPGRKEFNSMISRIEHGEARGIISWKANRLSRNPMDSGRISWLLQHNIIQHIQCYSEDYKPSDNVLLLQIALGMANQYIKDLGSDVKRGLRNKAKNGWYPIATLPIGYMRNSDKSSVKKIIPNPDTFPIVKKLWKLRLEKGYSIAGIKKKADALGLTNKKGQPYALNTYAQMLKNEFYAGYFYWRGADGHLERFEGKHKRMISLLEFQKALRLSEDKGRPSQSKIDDFTFRGPLVCGECQAAITAERKKQIICSTCKYKFSCLKTSACPQCKLSIEKMKSPSRIDKIYYRCTKRKKKNCSQKYIEETKLQSIILNRLQEIHLDKDFVELASEYIDNHVEQNKEEDREVKRVLEKRKTELQKKKESLVELRLNGEITADELKILRVKVDQQLQDNQRELEQMNFHSLNWKNEVETKLSWRNTCVEIFKNGSKTQKKELLADLGSNLNILNNELYFSRDFIGTLLDEWNRLYTLKKHGFEPKKSLILQGSFRDFEHLSSVMLAELKLVRT
ncbi:MAG: recombinase family protein [Flavobacteriales bacterium]|jgi:DNA invertase Pin-like site-specific DNA recombinase|nr:recombinase family protein [Flavobacteriales bacterium]